MSTTTLTTAFDTAITDMTGVLSHGLAVGFSIVLILASFFGIVKYIKSKIQGRGK